MQATVTEIGKHAIDDSEKMIILFGETATDTLKQHAVIQSFPSENWRYKLYNHKSGFFCQ